MERTLELVIPKTTSANLAEVLNICSKLVNSGGARQNKDGFKVFEISHGNISKNFIAIENVFSLAKNWKGFQMIYDGEIIGHQELQQINHVIRCASRRTADAFPEEYCQKPIDHNWGCFRLNRVRNGLPQITDNASMMSYYWFYYGTFNESFTEWHIDKNKIRAYLMKDAEENRIDICPFFKKSDIENGLKRLPDIIDLETDKSWEKVHKETLVGNTIRTVPVSIKPTFINIESTARIPLQFNTEPSEPNQEKARTDRNNKFIPNVTFDEIGGIDDIITNIREVIELPLKQPGLIRHLGIRPLKGVLLYGPPGCGKTLIAKAIANEVKAHFIPVCGPEILSSWHGKSEENLRNIFEEAKDKSPSIIFF